MSDYVTTDEMNATLAEVNEALFEEINGATIDPVEDPDALRTRNKVRIMSDKIGEAQADIYQTAHECEEIVTNGICVKRLPFDLLRKLQWIKEQKAALKTAIQALGTGMPDNEIFHDYYKWIKAGGTDPQPDIPESYWINNNDPGGKITDATAYTLHFRYNQPGAYDAYFMHGSYYNPVFGPVVSAPISSEYKGLLRVGGANGAVFGRIYGTTAYNSYDSRLAAINGIAPVCWWSRNAQSQSDPDYGVSYQQQRIAKLWKNGSSMNPQYKVSYISHVKGEQAGSPADLTREVVGATLPTGGSIKDGHMRTGFYFTPAAPSGYLTSADEFFISDVTLECVIDGESITIASIDKIKCADGYNLYSNSTVCIDCKITDASYSIDEMPNDSYYVTGGYNYSDYLKKVCCADSASGEPIYPTLGGFDGNPNHQINNVLKLTIKGSGGKYTKKVTAITGSFSKSNVNSISELRDGGNIYVDYYWRRYGLNVLYNTGTFPGLDPDYNGNQYIRQTCTIIYDFGSEAGPPTQITPAFVGDMTSGRVSSWDTPNTPEADSVTRSSQEAETEAEQQTGQPATDAATKILAYAVSKIGTPYPPTAEQNAGNRFGPTYYDCSGLVYKAVQAGGISIPTVSAEQYGYYRSRGGLFTSRASLRPGDLVFWSKKSSGSRSDGYGGSNYIHHVGLIYSVSGGTILIIDSGSKGVQKRNLWDGSGWVIEAFAHPES